MLSVGSVSSVVSLSRISEYCCVLSRISEYCCVLSVGSVSTVVSCL